MHTLYLNEILAAQICTHGAETYPHECCGGLLGLDVEAGREVRALFPLVNRRDDSPRNRFSITPDDFRSAERAAREAGLDLIGWYHSHPDHPALPSEYDREHAWPWYSYIIVSVAKGEAQAMASWRLADNRVRFEPEKITASLIAGAKAAAPDKL
jgi:proteasome lid subunit RPN8/RPN11